jgi:signal transduction histidine kinase
MLSSSRGGPSGRPCCQARNAQDGGETLRRGTFGIPIESRRILRRGDSPRPERRYCQVVSVTATRRFLTARRGAVTLQDVALAAVLFAGSVALLSHGGIDAMPMTGAASDSESRDLDPLGVTLVACSTAPLIAWRRSPLGVFIVTAAASVVLAGLGYPIDLPAGPAAALYLLAASRGRETPWTARTTGAVIVFLVAFLIATAAAQGSFPGVALFHTGLAWAVAWFAGERTRLRREHLAELAERARRGEREAEQERLLAAAEERARIARDLHDSAGHAISVIAVRAGAARLRHHQDPNRSLLALEAIEELARQTVDEIDQIVGTLRDGGANGSIEAPPGLVSLNTLLGRHRAAGLQVRVDTAGSPRPLSGLVDQSTYRILQEALTNAARHGAGSARIELAFGSTAVELTVTNPIRVDAPPRSGGGHGLTGMRERATLLGGSLSTERVNGAFRVRASIPYGDHAS